MLQQLLKRFYSLMERKSKNGLFITVKLDCIQTYFIFKRLYIKTSTCYMFNPNELCILFTLELPSQKILKYQMLLTLQWTKKTIHSATYSVRKYNHEIYSLRSRRYSRARENGKLEIPPAQKLHILSSSGSWVPEHSDWSECWFWIFDWQE